MRYDDNGQPVFVCAYTGCEKELGGAPSTKPGDYSSALWRTPFKPPE